ncbi:MAG: GreA/GreB family elongation factor, partial [Ilumatobacteraceae bacterium]
EEQTEHDIVSPESPLGGALLGHVDGDDVEYQGPRGTLKVKLLEVESA